MKIVYVNCGCENVVAVDVIISIITNIVIIQVVSWTTRSPVTKYT